MKLIMKINQAAAAKSFWRRRKFLSWISVAWAAFTAALLSLGTASARMMFPNALFEPPQTFKAGYPDELQISEVDLRFKQKERVWLVPVYTCSTPLGPRPVAE